ncbi:MAG: PorP/SprF family type IX secretion system membrane protein [Bacteroidales bacterium]|nr:PorP/SprF family type IX secretion system membrane protein [Bacteroidales bacterium]
MNSKRNLILFFFVFLVHGLFAQMAPVFTHHSYTNMYTNPGFAGMGEGICLNGIIRQQWAGFKDNEGNKVAPEDLLLTVDSPVKLLRGGLGGAIIQDKIGFYKRTGVQVGYAYHLELGAGTLGIGAAANFLNWTADFGKFIPSGDPALGKAAFNDMVIDANVGLFWQVEDSYYVGVSATNLLETKGKTFTNDAGSGSFVSDRTFHLTGGYQWILPNSPLFEIHPALHVLLNKAYSQINLSGTVVYNNRFWGGVNYRYGESIGVLIGMVVKDFRIGYAYDINTLGVSVPGSHEISLGYCFKIKGERSTRSYRNTRYL